MRSTSNWPAVYLMQVRRLRRATARLRRRGRRTTDASLVFLVEKIINYLTFYELSFMPERDPRLPPTKTEWKIPFPFEIIRFRLHTFINAYILCNYTTPTTVNKVLKIVTKL